MKISAFGLSRMFLLLLATLLLIFNFYGYNVNVIGVAIFVIYLGSIYIYRPIELVNNLLFFIAIIPMVIGGALIERGTYLFEIKKYAEWNGTFIVNLFFSMVFIEFLIYPFRPGKKKIALKINKYIIEGFIVVALLILYGTFLRTGIPLLNGVHRTVYFGSIVPDYVNLTKGRLSFACLALGLYYFNYKRKRYLFYFILIILYHILCSIKGGELLIVIYSFFLPVTLFYTARLHVSELKSIYRKIRIGLLFFTSLIAIVIFFNYQTVENYNQSTSALDKIEKRIEAAGQIWWAINDEAQVDVKYRVNDFFANFSSNPDKLKGMNQLMTEVVPAKILNEWRSPDARYKSLANGFPAIGFYYFGYVGVVLFIFLIGFLIIFIKKDILSSFESKDVLSFLFLGSLLEVVIRVVAQGDINLFFEFRTYIIVFAYALYSIIKNLSLEVKHP